MAEGSSPPPRRRDGFIAARKAELARAIAGESSDGEAMQEVLRLLGALMHHEAHERLEALKALYDPLDPDAPPARCDQSEGAFRAFESALVETLGRANYLEIDPDTVQTRRQTNQLTGLSIKASIAGIRRIRYFARGSRAEQLEYRTWFGLRRRTIAADVMNDVVVLVGFKDESEIKGADRRAFASMSRGLRPGAAMAKHFRDVATPELVTLHPGAKPSMRPRDQV